MFLGNFGAVFRCSFEVFRIVILGLFWVELWVQFGCVLGCGFGAVLG